MSQLNIELICVSYEREKKVALMVETALTSYPTLRIILNCEASTRGTTHLLNKEISNSIADMVIYTPDDIQFDIYSIPRAINLMHKEFPDFDGMVGFRQSNIPNCNGASVGILGEKFIDRFPNREALCPDFRALYNDSELKRYAESVGKYALCENATVIHSHPSVCPEAMDRTHKRQSKHKELDHAVRAERDNRGLLWGRDTTRVTNE